MTKDEIIEWYHQTVEPIARGYNERIARAGSNERMAELHREYLMVTKPILDQCTKLLAMMPPEPMIIPADMVGRFYLPPLDDRAAS